MPLTIANREKLKGLYNALADRVLEPGDPVDVAQVNCQGPTDGPSGASHAELTPGPTDDRG